MALILNIDTALETASVCLAQNGMPLKTVSNKDQKGHAEWLQSAIAELMKASGSGLKDLDAVAVTIGPGSYTGLRVGLSSAKGLCYALKIPLITVDTLKMMASAARNVVTEADLLCPMIDARRMEVFTAVYTKALKEIISPGAMLLANGSFSELLVSYKIFFFGSGSKKFISLQNHDNAMSGEVNYDASEMSALSMEDFRKDCFADLAYCEPFYLKDFFHPSARDPYK
ncbi:MAG: tRNA (adenosine(37)-N6)-threonylcarbamoyltransferase complex dimerization subunit type 1 TsaB [Chitinophagales bacterium]|nr:tRNA (adenosine(37)-N6)-threonylcarbamoyltransferase complex dimerization subunit type 1 TsaB [Chitinophagales bacterium]